MCQQWLSVLGQTADVIGFTLIAIEWYRTFVHGNEMRQAELNAAYERYRALERGEAPGPTEDELMAREFSKLQRVEAHSKFRLFIVGACFVISGFLLQVLGSWPGADPIFGLKGCS